MNPDAVTLLFRLTLPKTADAATLRRPHRRLRLVPPHASENRGRCDTEYRAHALANVLRLTLPKTADAATSMTVLLDWPECRLTLPKTADAATLFDGGAIAEEFPPHASENRGRCDTDDPTLTALNNHRLTLPKTADAATPRFDQHRGQFIPPHASENRGRCDRVGAAVKMKFAAASRFRKPRTLRRDDWREAYAR